MIITRGLGSNLLITRGYGQGVEPTPIVDPYCQMTANPYEQSEKVYVPYNRIGVCASLLEVYDKIKLWHLQQKPILNAIF
jgi:hypothetical protein